MKILNMILRPGEPHFAALTKRFPDDRFVELATIDDLRREAPDADAFITSAMPYTPELAEVLRARAPRLRWMQSRSAGLDRFIAAGIPKGVVFSNAAGVNGSAVAEHAMTLLFTLQRGLIEMERDRLRRVWRAPEYRKSITAMEGSTVGVVGLGSIGREIAKRAKAFDMTVVGIVRRPDARYENVDRVVPIGEMRAALPSLDSLILSLPLSRETRHLIGRAELAAMKPSAYLVNVSRGGVVDQKALTETLEARRIRGAGLDVTEPEPLNPDDPLWALDNVIISPHVAGTSEYSHKRFADLVATNLERLKRGEPLVNLIDGEVFAPAAA